MEINFSNLQCLIESCEFFRSVDKWTEILKFGGSTTYSHNFGFFCSQ